MDLADLKPYFQGTTTHRRAVLPGSASPYMPKASSVSGCSASSMRRPSV
jgi:hypothetical protein